MDKEILSEINRFREILGQSLLTEATPPFNLLQTIFKMVGGSSDNLLTTVLKTSKNPEVSTLKAQIDSVAKELGQSPDDLIRKIQADELSPEEFDTLVYRFMMSNEWFYKRLFTQYVENSKPLKQIDDILGSLEKRLEETGIAPTGEDIGILQKHLFKTIDDNPKLSIDIKNLIKERIADRLSKLPISPKRIKPNFVPQPDPSWTNNFKLKSDSFKMSDWQTLGRPYNQTTYKNLEPFKDQFFDPQRIKWMDFSELQSVEGGEPTIRKVARLVIDDKVPFLIYTSSGKSTPGLKKEGQWTIFSGWVLRPDDQIGWWIKGNEEQILWTQGSSEFFTGLANYLKNNNINGLKKY